MRFIDRGCLAIIWLACWSGLAAANVTTAQLVAEISVTNYTATVNDQLYARAGQNRAFGQPGHDAARVNIRSAFEGFGLATILDPFSYNSTTCYNVVAEHRGTVHPDWIYVVGAHYDSAGTGVPGADDNASGVAGVLEMARVLSQRPFEATIRFIAFDCEENGLIGSTAYANACAAASEDIRGMVSMDMIAYNPRINHNSAYLYYDNDLSSPPDIMQDLVDSFALYGNGLSTTVARLSYNGSDHAPFAHNGYQAALVIEHEAWNNPYYHKAFDAIETPDYIDYVYATNMTRAVAGYLSDNTVLVPEPGSLLAATMGATLLLIRRRR